MRYTFSAPDISCGHCKMRIESTLNKAAGVSFCEVHIETKEVVVESDLQASQLIDIIDQAGYDAVLVQA